MLYYGDGTWFGVVRSDLALLVPSTEQPVVESWWRLVAEAGSLSELHDAARVAGRLPTGYAMLSWRDPGPELVVDGPVHVDSGAPGSVAGDAWTPLETAPGQCHALESGVGIRILVEPVADNLMLPVTEAVVRTGSLLLAPQRQPSAAGDAVPAPDQQLDDSVTDEYDFLFGKSVLFDAARAAVRRPDSAERASTGGQPDRALRLTLPDGEAVVLDRVVIVGRAPFTRESEPGETTRLLKVGGVAGEVSRNHLELRPTSDGSVFATDLGSTNGTVLIRPGLGPQQLRSDQPARLTAGCVLELGRTVTLVVSAAS